MARVPGGSVGAHPELVKQPKRLFRRIRNVFSNLLAVRCDSTDMRTLPPEPRSREITPKALYVSRREIIKNGALTLGTAAVVSGSLSVLVGMGPPPDLPEVAALP